MTQLGLIPEYSLYDMQALLSLAERPNQYPDGDIPVGNTTGYAPAFARHYKRWLMKGKGWNYREGRHNTPVTVPCFAAVWGFG